MEYDSFVTRLRITRSYLANHPTHGSWEEAGVVEQAADAIVALRSDLAAARAERDLWRKRALGVAPPPRFANVSCSQCGREFGPGDHGYSHCKDHSDAALAGEKK